MQVFIFKPRQKCEVKGGSVWVGPLFHYTLHSTTRKFKVESSVEHDVKKKHFIDRAIKHQLKLEIFNAETFFGDLSLKTLQKSFWLFCVLNRNRSHRKARFPQFKICWFTVARKWIGELISQCMSRTWTVNSNYAALSHMTINTWRSLAQNNRERFILNADIRLQLFPLQQSFYGIKSRLSGYTTTNISCYVVCALKPTLFSFSYVFRAASVSFFNCFF